MLHGHGQNFPVRFKHCARARGRNVPVLNLLGGMYVVRPHSWKIAGDLDIDGVLLPGRWIEHVDRTKLLVNDRVRTRRSRFDIHTVARERQAHLLCAGVIGIQTHWPVAIGEEINFVPDPHRRGIIGILARHFFHAGIGKFRDPDGRSRAASVVFQPAMARPRFREIRKWHIRQM